MATRRAKSAVKSKTRAPRRVARNEALALPADCAVPDLTQLKSHLSRFLGAKRAVRIDAGAIKRVDTPTLQLLAAFVREHRLKGQAVEWLALTPPFLESVRCLGLASALEITLP